MIDEVAVYKDALTAGEVTTIYNAGTPNDLSGLASYGDNDSWYRMGDDDTFPTLTDNTSSNNATMTNMTIGNIVNDTP